MDNHHLFLNYSRVLIHGLTKLNSVSKDEALFTHYCRVQWLTSYQSFMEWGPMGHLMLPKMFSKTSPYTRIFTCLALIETIQKKKKKKVGGIFLLEKKLVSDVKYLMLLVLVSVSWTAGLLTCSDTGT